MFFKKDSGVYEYFKNETAYWLYYILFQLFHWKLSQHYQML